MKIRWVLLILIPVSALLTGLQFLDAERCYRGSVVAWPGRLAQPEIHPRAAASDRILLFPVRKYERWGLVDGEYPHYVHPDDSPSAWTHRSILQGMYVYGAAVACYFLARLLIPRAPQRRVTWLLTGVLFILLFSPGNLTERGRTDCCPAAVRGWPLWITGRDSDTGGDSALGSLWSGNRSAVLVNATLLGLAALGAARILVKLNSRDAIAEGTPGQ